jgi:MinD-like ATPase involved in chromosome partitioning or flagellar assembly
MYIVTFYSFKGGVGRSMAMANVGLALAKAGRRVLLVDFDLEAPGLDTFNLLRPAAPTLGVVDYVTEYRETGIAPEVTRFLYERSDLGLDGKLWVMPTGKQDENYGIRLNAIDWHELYLKQDGYLLFEDLKAQWARDLRPDYVLVDSRTGHTDVGGICTRQLPDAVVLLFFPNEQNRRGLNVVVQDIRRESRSIDLCFVAANVPDLDDEENILRNRLKEFEQTLDCSIDARIRHYDSLSLLEQTVFTIERPHTRLAREYNQLAQKITSRNLEDRNSVMGILEGIVTRGLPPRTKPEDITARLKKICELYHADGEILYMLARANQALGRATEADHLFAEAEQRGFLSEDKLVRLAKEQYSSGALESARESALRAMELAGARVFVLERVLTLAVAHDPAFLADLLGHPSVQKLDSWGKRYLPGRVMIRKEVLPIIEVFLQKLVSGKGDNNQEYRSDLSVCLIAERKFAEAQRLIEMNSKTLAERKIPDSFNYAMASWGSTKAPSKQLFERVLALDVNQGQTQEGPNYLQCLAITNYVVGRFEAARDYSLRARTAINKAQPDWDFSAWRYLRVPKSEFLKDLDALDKMIDSTGGEPRIIAGDRN